MPKLALYNIAFGFAFICIAAAAGAFVSTALTEQFLAGIQHKDWLLTLKTSAHGHSNMFGMIHILFGLTLPYSKMSLKTKKLQTVGIALGSLAVSAGLLVIGIRGPVPGIHIVEVLNGALLSCALLGLLVHVYGIVLRAQN
jgi:hypothetical protein